MSENIKWAKAEIQKHRSAIADLEAYIRVEELKAPAAPAGAQPPAVAKIVAAPMMGALPLDEPASSLAETVFPRGYKKRTILTVLQRNPNGLRTPDIVELCKRAGLVDTEVSNTSPQLSSYGSGPNPLVTHDGNGIWTLLPAGLEWLRAQKD